MSATYELFTRWKKAHGHESDNAGAIALRVTRGTVSLWKNGANAGADIIERMAVDLGENPAAWAARSMSEQAKGDAARAWARIAKKLAAAAACVLVVAGLTPAPAHAKNALFSGDFGANVYYVTSLEPMRTVERDHPPADPPRARYGQARRRRDPSDRRPRPPRGSHGLTRPTLTTASGSTARITGLHRSRKTP